MIQDNNGRWLLTRDDVDIYNDNVDYNTNTDDGYVLVTAQIDTSCDVNLRIGITADTVEFVELYVEYNPHTGSMRLAYNICHTDGSYNDDIEADYFDPRERDMILDILRSECDMDECIEDLTAPNEYEVKDAARMKPGFHMDSDEATMHFSFANGCSVSLDFFTDDDFHAIRGWQSAKWVYATIDIPDDCDCNRTLLARINEIIPGGLAQYGRQGERYQPGNTTAPIGIEGLGAVLTAAQTLTQEAVNAARVNKRRVT